MNRRVLAGVTLVVASLSAGAATPPVLTRVEPKEWTLHHQIDLTIPVDTVPIRSRDPVVLVGDAASFVVHRAEVYFALPRETASSTTVIDDPGFGAGARFDGVQIADGVAAIAGPAWLGDVVRLRIDPPNPPPRDAIRLNDGGAAVWFGRRLEVFLDIPMVCHQTRLDEARAREVPWPTGRPPADVAALLTPEPLIESDAPAIVALVREWTGGRARSVAPIDAAKDLTGRVVERFMPVTLGYEFNSKGRAEGLSVRGAAAVVDEERANPFDITLFHVAVLRAAGLPARLVIGLDAIETRRRRFPTLRAWTELLLYDERDDTREWIPIDVVAQRLFSSRAPPITQRWQHFGHSETLDDLIPIGHSLMPPVSTAGATIAYGSPALWGWRPTPDDQTLDQALRSWAMRTVKRGRP